MLIRGMSIDILARIGFVVPVALASTNPILIVEFAKQAEDAGGTVRDAAFKPPVLACGRSW
jgi:multidrug efflux pump subunit AcrB